jgi:acetyltransferase-like isoleucine patch superfamily enzyme
MGQLIRLFSKMRYSGDQQGRFRKYIFRHLICTTFRGAYFSALKLSSAGPISIGNRVSIEGPKSHLIFGARCKIERGVFIQCVSQSAITCGDDVTICEGALIRPSGYWGGPLGVGLQMGNRSSIGAYSYIGCSGPIVIGNDVMMGPRVTMIAENHNFHDITTPINTQGVSNRGIRVGNDVWVGACVTILDGVTIADHSILASGSVVTKDVLPYEIVAGVPARPIRSRKLPSARNRDTEGAEG